MTHHVVSMPHQDFAFDAQWGTGPIHNRMGDSGRLRPRWLSLELFKTKGRTYVLVRIAHSVVVHEEHAPCVVEGKAAERGKVVPVAQVPQDYMPCHRAELASRRRCYPDMTGRLVRMEQDKTTVFRSQDPAQIIAWLSEAKRRDGGGTSDMQSRPMERLLELARTKDRAFRIHPVVHVA